MESFFEIRFSVFVGVENFLPQRMVVVCFVVGVENFQPLQQNTPPPSVVAKNFQPLQKRKNEFQKMIPRSIGSIVKGFKIGVTKWFRTNTNLDTVWQRNYHEHIIRSEQSYLTISNYIINNPANWKNDKFNK